MIDALISSWHVALISVSANKAEVPSMDEWHSVCDETFRVTIENQLGRKVSARAAVSLMGALVGEGIVADHSRSPTVAQLAALEGLHGRECIYGMKGSFCIANIKQIIVRSRGFIDIAIHKSRDLLDASLPSELPAGSKITTFIELLDWGYVISEYGLFEIIIKKEFIDKIIKKERNSPSKQEFRDYVRSIQSGQYLDF